MKRTVIETPGVFSFTSSLPVSNKDSTTLTIFEDAKRTDIELDYRKFLGIQTLLNGMLEGIKSKCVLYFITGRSTSDCGTVVEGEKDLVCKNISNYLDVNYSIAESILDFLFKHTNVIDKIDFIIGDAFSGRYQPLN